MLFFTSLYLSTQIKADDSEKIAVILSSNHSMYMKTLSGLKYSFRKKTSIYYLNTIDDTPTFFRKMDSLKNDYIITIGNRATKTARKYLKKKIIVFLMVNNPHSLSYERGNICGFTADISSKDFFRVLKKIKPDAKTVYSFYSDDNGKYLANEGRYHDLWNGVKIKPIEIGPEQDIDEQLEQIRGKADSFYMVHDKLYDRKSFATLSEFCLKNKMILMTYYPGLARIGTTFALAPDYTGMGLRAGNFLNQKSAIKTCQKGKVFSPKNSFLYLNHEYARKSGIQLSQEIRNREKKERLLAYGIELYNKKKYNSALSVFSEVNKIDPEEALAIQYKSEIFNIKNSHKIKENINRADTYFKSGNYNQAILYYRKVLSLNSEMEGIQQKLDQAILKKSETIRKKAISQDHLGQPFVAIRLLKESISIYPNNSKAKASYTTIISRERRNLLNYMKAGMKLYNKRKYKKSVEIFENILLIDSGNKAASEYLHNSLLKQEAMQRLLECNGKTRKDCRLWKK